jgi:hypothetical protein
MTYDLRRLRLHGLITRLPGTHTYITTLQGLRVAAFYTKLGDRVLEPLLAADHPPAPIEVRRALATLDCAVGEYVTNAALALQHETCHNVTTSSPQERLGAHEDIRPGLAPVAPRATSAAVHGRQRQRYGRGRRRHRRRGVVRVTMARSRRF